MAGYALKRLLAEYKQLQNNPPEGIIAGPISEENFFDWECFIVRLIYWFSERVNPFKLKLQNQVGPEGTCFENAVLSAKLQFPTDYPLSPPKMTFTTPDLLHPNIYPDGSKSIFLFFLIFLVYFLQEKSVSAFYTRRAMIRRDMRAVMKDG